MRRFLVLLSVVVIAACAAFNSQKSQPAKADNLHFKNLKVLSPNITHDALVATMRTWARSLGTHCEHCHVQSMVDGKEVSDFASDAKPEKNIARTMYRMTTTINDNYISKVGHDEKVACATCHRGHVIPEQWTPPPPPERRPEGSPTPPVQPSAPVPAPGL